MPLGEALKQRFKLPFHPMKNPRIADEWETGLDEKREVPVCLPGSLNDAEGEFSPKFPHSTGLGPRPNPVQFRVLWPFSVLHKGRAG